MPQAIPAVLRVTPGDRVLVRDRLWRVGTRHELAGGVSLLHLEALDGGRPDRLSVLSPPDEVMQLASATPRFSAEAIEAFAPWARAHRILAASLVRDVALPWGARFGRIAPETYQLVPTLRLLAKPRPRLLVADDVGLGKTIEAGMAMLELLARGRAARILIVTPPGLLLQWRDELREKFGLDFTLLENAAGLGRAQADLPAGVSPWDALPRVLTSVDFVKKETIARRALRKRWDLVIVDEAHALAESGSPHNPYATQRTRLGRRLAEGARGLLLLTATPHNGYRHSFRSLLELVEPSAATLEGAPDDLARRVRAAMVRRMKPQILRRRTDGKEEPVFPPRTVRGIAVTGLDPAEAELLRKVGAYCSKTTRSAADTEDADLVSFAMQIVKKRALSSRKALESTIEHRLEALRKGAKEPESPPSQAELRDLQAALPQVEAAAERTAIRILRAAIPREEKMRKAEVSALNGLRKLLRSLPARDPKLEALLSEVRTVRAGEPAEKFIVFTEYRDTLDALRAKLDAAPDLAGRYAVLRGGLSARQRLGAQARFEHADTVVLLATDAASEGLNLQRSCRRVIHIELPWNPNRLEQRNGRVDRYLQTRPPEIRYLYYPNSPEDDVLHQLVDKIQTMRDDRVSTPDILGVLQGAGELERALVELDPEADDVARRKEEVVRKLDDRKEEYARTLGTILLAGSAAADDAAALAESLHRADPLLPEGDALEKLVIGALGRDAVAATAIPGVWRIQVPPRLRGPGVVPAYPHATFRRSIAIRHRASDVEFLTPLHPLGRALETEARRQLLQAYAGDGASTPRRLAARRVPKGDSTSTVFTFLGEVRGGSLAEEHLLAVRLAPDLHPVGTPEDALAWIDPEAAPGEVPLGVLESRLRDCFDTMLERAAAIAAETLQKRARALCERRATQAEELRVQVRRDLEDRLREIDEEEQQATGRRGAVGVQYLFAMADESARGFETRRAAARDRAEAALHDADEFTRVDDPAAPRPLGALFLVP